MLRKTIIIVIWLFYVISFFGQNWSGLAEQIDLTTPNSKVGCLFNDGDSILYIGGTFRNSTDGVLFPKIAKWDGEHLLPVGCGFNWDCVDETTAEGWGSGSVSSILRFQDTLYAGGYFWNSGENMLNNVAKWDGTEWLPVGLGFDFAVNELVVLNDTLYACGDFSFSGALEINGLAKWTGSEWLPVHDLPQFGPNPNNIADVAIYNDEIYVSGNFGSSQPGYDDLLHWNGSEWAPVGGGFYGGLMAVANLEVYDGQLIVAGSMSTDESDNNPGTGIVAWNGLDWFDYLGGIDDPQSTSWTGITGLTVYDDKIYIFGPFNVAGGVIAHGIAFWSVDHWCAFEDTFDSGDAESYPFGGIFFQDSLYVFGYFFAISGNNQIQAIAKYLGGDICEVSGMADTKYETDFLIFPNPASDVLSISGMDVQYIDKLTILNSIGQCILEISRAELASRIQSGNLDVSRLERGVYFIQISTSKTISRMRFIKE